MGTDSLRNDLYSLLLSLTPLCLSCAAMRLRSRVSGARMGA